MPRSRTVVTPALKVRRALSTDRSTDACSLSMIAETKKSGPQSESRWACRLIMPGMMVKRDASILVAPRASRSIRARGPIALMRLSSMSTAAAVSALPRALGTSSLALTIVREATDFGIRGLLAVE